MRLAPTTPTVRELARRVRVRAQHPHVPVLPGRLPSAKRYLAAIRLLYAAQYFESEGLSVADAAYRLQCSSPQSFGRHVRSLFGITCTEFRRRFPFPVALERFGRVMVDPYVGQWRAFHPLGKRGGPRECGAPDAPI